MEPLFFKAENRRRVNQNKRHAVTASMEPLFFKAENTVVAGVARNGAICFNGAAFFQSGKSEGGGREKKTLFLLQWSRFFSKRKIPDPTQVSRNPPPRFNGAAFFQSGKSPHNAESLAASRTLQWSRFFSKRKISARLTRRRTPPCASMEPLFFKAENGSG